MREKLFWIAIAFIILGCLRLVYDPLYETSVRQESQQVLTIHISELPPMMYREVK